MTITAIQAIELLQTIAQTASSSGLVPQGPATIALGFVAIGLHSLIESGAITPQSVIEIDDIGQGYEAALQHMREVLAERTQLGQMPPA